MKLSNLIHLIQNENMKIYRRIATLVMIGLLILLVIVVGVIENYISSDQTSNWRSNIVAENQRMNQILQSQTFVPKAQKDQFDKQIAINNYRLEHDIPPIQSKTLWGFMNDTTNLISLITLFTIIIAAGSVAGEFSWGTIKLLLIRPVIRSKILLSKYLASILFAFILLVILFISSFLFGGLLFGFKNVNLPYLSFTNGNVVETNMVFHIISLYGYSTINLVMMTTFAFMISTVFRSSSLAIGLAIFLMFTGEQIVVLLSKYQWVKYLLFANTDLTQYIDGVPLVKGMTLQFSIIMLVLYFVAFNALSWITFNKRDIAA